MDLRDSADEAVFRTGLRGWLARNCPSAGDGPLDAYRPGAPVVPRDWAMRLYAAGYAGLTWPRKHGGAGLSASYQGIYAEESALAGAADQYSVIGLNMVGPTLIAHGTEVQQAEYLPRILKGESLFCQGFSEPGAGSDLAAVRTRARPVTGGHAVDGEKIWSSYAGVADYCLLLARTATGPRPHDGLTCFLLDMRAPGVTVRPLRMLTGEAGFGQIVLEDVFIPEAAIVGEPGTGWRVALATLGHERGTFGITLTARLSVQFSRLLATVRDVGREHDPLVRRDVAAIYVDLDGLRQTGYRALTGLQRTGAPGPESSVLKLLWSKTHQRATRLGLDLATGGGHAGWTRYWHHELLRSRGNTIEGGTSEILYGIVAEHVAGLPRSR